MKPLLLVFGFLISIHHLIAQCECTDCPVFVPNNAVVSSSIVISGANSPTLGVNGQDLCRVCIDLFTDAIQEIEFTLIAPDGSTVILFQDSGINVNSNMSFDICFVPCATGASPDAGFPATFMTNAGWQAGTTYTGTYYPEIGCLEDFTGSVDGTWTLQMEDVFVGDASDLFDWYLVFENDSGLNCANSGECGTTCFAEAGDVTVTTSPSCPLTPIDVLVQNYETSNNQFILITDLNGNIIQVNNTDFISYIGNTCGDFNVYSYNFDPNGGAPFPTIGDNINTYDCPTLCCDLEMTSLSVVDNDPPVFTFIPEHPNFPGGGGFTPIECIDAIPPPEQALYDDLCIGNGGVFPIETSNLDPCNGGTLIRRWEIQDLCNLPPTIEEQVITVEPLPLGAYDNTPPDLSLNCFDLPFTPETLTWSNGLSGICEDGEIVDPEVVLDYNVCGGEIINTWTAFDRCGRIIQYQQRIDIAPLPVPSYVDPPVNQSIDCDQIPSFYDDLILTNNDFGQCAFEESIPPFVINNFNGCDGDIQIIWTYQDPCGSTYDHEQFLFINQIPEANFVNTPQDITVNCDELDFVPTSVLVSNFDGGECAIETFVEADIFGDPNIECGTELEYFWSYTDPCGRSIAQSQFITVNPKPLPEFIDPPADVTISCSDVDMLDNNLFYSNNSNVIACSDEGFVSAEVDNQSDPVCGGAILYTWKYFNSCGDSIQYIQNINILPPQLPAFENPPIDTTLDCGSDDFNPVSLRLSNDDSLFCRIDTLIAPLILDQDSLLVITWQFPSICTNDTILAIQNVFLRNPVSLNFITDSLTVCESESIDLNSLIEFDDDINDENITFYQDQNLSDTIFAGLYTIGQPQMVYVQAIAQNGCAKSDSLFLDVNTFINIADNTNLTFCEDTENVNLLSMINNLEVQNGIWFDLDNTNLDLSDPENVNIGNLLPGDYDLLYTQDIATPCLIDSAIIRIQIDSLPNWEADIIRCNVNLEDYLIQFNSNDNYSYNSNFGDFLNLGNSSAQFENIPADSNFTITVTDLNTLCTNTFIIDAPDCSCPNVEQPTAQGDIQICISELPITLNASAIGNTLLNWYDAPTGGIPLAQNTDSYIPNISNSGSYSFFVEAVDPDNANCTSTSRTQIIVEVLELPQTQIYNFQACVSPANQIASFHLDDIQSQISSNYNNAIVSIHESQSNAEANIDPLTGNFDINSSTDVLFFIVFDENNCSAIDQINLTTLPYPNASLDIQNESCLDLADGTVTIVFDDHDTNIFTSIDNLNFQDTNAYSQLGPNDYIIFLEDENQCTNSIPFNILEGQELSIANFIVDCNDNETREDTTDDFYSVNIIIDSNIDNIDGTFSITNLNQSFGEYLYGEAISLQFPADETNLELLFTDLNSGCNIAAPSIPLINCSEPCSVFPDATIFLDPDNILNCSVQSINAMPPMQDNVSYQWVVNNDNIIANQVTIEDASQVILIALDTISGCSSIDTVNILDLEAYPRVELQASSILTCNQTTISIDGSLSQQDPQLNYEWFFSDTTQLISNVNDSISIQNEGWYYLQITDPNIACSNIDSIFIDADFQQPDITLDDNLLTECGDEMALIELDFSGTNNPDFTWSLIDGNINNNNNQQNLVVNQSGSYTITIENLDNGCQSSDTIIVQFRPDPQLEFTNILNENCFGQNNGQIVIEPIDNGNLPFNFFVNGNLTPFAIIDNLAPGAYNLSAVDFNGCTIDTSFTILAAQNWQVELPQLIEINITDELQLEALTNLNPDDILNISWSNGNNLSCNNCLNPEITNLTPGDNKFTIEITDNKGCVQSASITIRAIQETNIYTPSAFSPNQDGNNDFFVIYSNLELENLSMQIYDRWGNKVFDKNELHNSSDEDFWNGDFNGEPVQPGVYVYRYEMTVLNSGEVITGHGDVTVFR